jgi:hypothetical protein
MRTTVALDDDVAAFLEDLGKAKNAALKDIVNDALRPGLRELANRKRQRADFSTRSVDLGRPYLANIDNIAETIDPSAA